MENESKRDRNRRKMREARFAREAKIPDKQKIVQEDWTLEEYLPDDVAEDELRQVEEVIQAEEEVSSEPAWKNFEDKPQWKKFDENLPPGLAKKEDKPKEKKPKKKKGKKKDNTFSDW